MDRNAARRELARRELARRGSTTAVAEPESQPEKSWFESPAARLVFPGVGGTLGTAAGVTLGTAAGGVGAAPGGFVGATTGAGMGESLRELLARMTGGGNPSDLDAYGEVANQAAYEAAGQGIGAGVVKAAQGAGKVAGAAGRYLYRNIPEPALDYARKRFQEGVNLLDERTFQSREALFGGIQKLRAALETIHKKPPAPPGKESLYPVAEKAANAFEAVREGIGARYGQAATVASENEVGTSLVGARNVLMKEAKAGGLLDAQGNRLNPFGRATGEEQAILGILDDLGTISSRPIEGAPGVVSQGTFARYTMAKRLLNRIDETLGGVRTRNAKRILLMAREQVQNGLLKSDEALGAVSPEYAQMAGLRDVFETAFKDPDKTVYVLSQSLGAGKKGLAEKLKLLDELAPPEMKFLADLDTYNTQIRNAKLAMQAPKSLSNLLRNVKTDEDLEKLVTGIFSLPEVTRAELEALEASTGTPFLSELQDVAASRLFRGSTPAGLFQPAPNTQGKILRASAPGIDVAGRVAREKFQPYVAPGITNILRILGTAASDQ